MSESGKRPERKDDAERLKDIAALYFRSVEPSRDNEVLAAHIHEDELSDIFEGEIRERIGYDIYQESEFVAAHAAYVLYDESKGFKRCELLMVTWDDIVASIDLVDSRAYLLRRESTDESGIALSVDSEASYDYIIVMVERALFQLDSSPY